MIVADLLAELVALPTQQAGPERGAGDERALCEHLAPMLRARGADEVDRRARAAQRRRPRRLRVRALGHAARG